MTTATHPARPIVAFLRAALVSLVALAAGCVAPMVVDYQSFHKKEFAPRAKPAEFHGGSTQELLAGGYLLIGYIDVRYNVRACYSDGTCSKIADSPPTREDLQKQAAERGADAITLLEDQVILEKHVKSYCTHYTTQIVMINNKPQTITVCGGYNHIPGFLEARISRALFWRHEPAEATSDANYRAIRQAMASLAKTYGVDGNRAAPAPAKAPQTEPTVPARDDSRIQSAKRGTSIPASGNIALITAIEREDIETINELARDRAKREWRDDKGRTALMLAVQYRRNRAARALLAVDRELTVTDNQGATALAYAAANADLAMVRELVRAGYDLRARDREGNSLLSYAVFNDDGAVLDWLLKQGLDARKGNKHGATPLMIAAAKGWLEPAKRLLRAGVPLEQRANDKATALFSAVQSARPDVVALLLKHKADANAAADSGNTPLIIAAGKGDLAIVKQLLAHGARVNQANGKGGTPLVAALVYDHWDVAKHLIAKGARLGSPRWSAAQSFAFLIEKNQLDLARLYLEREPSLRAHVRKSTQPMLSAARYADGAMIKLLASYGANVNGFDARAGSSPLLVAASSGNASAARALLELKADPRRTNAHRQTPLMVATVAGHVDVVQAMRAFGVKE